MAEYIDREAALMKLMQDGCSAKNLQSISDMPAADVAPIEALERLRDEMCAQDLITMEGLRKLNTLIKKQPHDRQ